ncbi:MAG: NADH-quinone oxidoreductase subunit H [Candidatus Omnitrophica bacterium]|nr:NADH-quinone oxidoreductase subunit H [Candidatus Omnitrophota bacterium]
MKTIVQFLIFPGFLFTAVVGLIASWIDRKVTARVQWRVGPPWYQPFVDMVKLLGKETIIPKGTSAVTFLTAPLVGLASVTLISMLLWLTLLNPGKGFIGDLIVVLYLSVIPAVSIIIGGFASRNPLASLGASREMKLVLGYELPFVLALLVPVIKAGGSIRLDEIVASQMATGATATSLSGVLALIVAIMCMQAKLTLVPFDLPEAETELMGGAYIEYSGPPLAVYKLTKHMFMFALPIFLVMTFMGGFGPSPISLILGLLKYVALLVIIVLIRNTNPRVRIDQAVRFFWGPMTLFAIVAVALAFLGW